MGVNQSITAVIIADPQPTFTNGIRKGLARHAYHFSSSLSAEGKLANITLDTLHCSVTCTWPKPIQVYLFQDGKERDRHQVDPESRLIITNDYKVCDPPPKGSEYRIFVFPAGKVFGREGTSICSGDEFQIVQDGTYWKHPNLKLLRRAQFRNVKVKYQQFGKDAIKDCDCCLLIIACDPQELMRQRTIDFTQQEKDIYGRYQHFTFQTTVFKFPVADPSVNSVRFAPKRLARMDGSVYGYRSETRKTFEGLPPTAEFEIVTVYQLLDPSKPGNRYLTQEELSQKLIDDFAQPDNDLQDWFPYDFEKREQLDQFHTAKYFNHFSIDGVQNDLPWKTRDLQFDVQNATILAHASYCFESVLHIYQSLQLLDTKEEQIKDLMIRKDHPILILGGGPSGLLSARKFHEKGFTNITIFEKRPDETMEPDLLTGKTQTHIIQQKIDGVEKPVVAELGTCYLSPAYNNMMEDLADVTVGNKRISFEKDTPDAFFFGIVIEDQFALDGPVMTLRRGGKLQLDADNAGSRPGATLPSVIDYSRYVELMAFEQSYNLQELSGASEEDKLKALEEAFTPSSITWELLKATVKYMVVHWLQFGSERPFPQDSKLSSNIKSMTALQFLKSIGATSLIGALQYAYSVQGYGSLNEIPAYYLLVWITPQNLIAGIVVQAVSKWNGLIEELYSAVCGRCAVMDATEKLFENSVDTEEDVSPVDYLDCLDAFDQICRQHEQVSKRLSRDPSKKTFDPTPYCSAMTFSVEEMVDPCDAPYYCAAHGVKENAYTDAFSEESIARTSAKRRRMESRPKGLVDLVLDKFSRKALEVLKCVFPEVLKQVKYCEDCNTPGKLSVPGVVTCWEKGWGDVWKQQKAKLKAAGIKLEYSVDVTNIQRVMTEADIPSQPWRLQ